MKTILRLSLLLLLSISLQAMPPASPAQDTIIFDLLHKEINRKISFDFHNSMLHLSEPSTVNMGLPFDTYHFFGAPQKRPLILSVDSKMPIALAGKNWYSRKSGLFYTLQMVPQFHVRIFRDNHVQGDSSRSVRTPSYIPGAHFFITHKSLWGVPLKMKKFENVQQHYFFRLRGFHHSNGQDEQEFNQDGTINTYNGNFGEGLVFEGAIGGYYTSKSDKLDSLTRRRVFFHPRKFTYQYQKQINAYWRLGYEYHPVINETIRTNPRFDEYDLLGRNIVRLQMGLISSPKTQEYAIHPGGQKILQSKHEARERWRVVLNLSYIADRKLNTGPITDLQPVGLGNLGKRANIDLTFYKKTYGNEHAAWFAQVGYHGSDPYNLYFQQSVLFYRVGIAWSFFKFE